MTTLWWGTYPKAGLGTPAGLGEGIWRQRGEEAIRVLELPAPSFVLAHPDMPVLYAVSETDATVVHAIDISDPEAPTVVASIPTGGSAGCHLLLSPDALTLYVSHYGSGDLAVIALSAAGEFAADAPVQTFGHSGSGPREDRQESSHAHFAGFAPGGDHLLVVDLGTDQLRRYRVEPGGTLTADGIAATLPPGAGPRHFAVRGSLIYVVCELDHTLRTLRWDGATASALIVDEQPTTRAPQRTGNTIYDGHVVALEHTLLVSVRGCDVISVFDLGPEGDATYRASFDSGFWPRHFAVIGETFVVGCERGHEVRVFDLADVLGIGAESEVGQIQELPYVASIVESPACVAAT